MPLLKFVLTLTVIIIVAVLIVGLRLSGLWGPAFPLGNNEKTSANSSLQTIALKKLQKSSGISDNDYAIIHQVFLNNSTHIETPYVNEYSMPNGTWPNSILYQLTLIR
jgi:hypothetical protein